MDTELVFEFLCKISFFITVGALLLGCFNNIGFWFSIQNPQASGYDASIIDIVSDPIQTGPVDKTPIQLKVNNKNITLLPQADYNISGMVIAQNWNFGLRGVFFYNDFDRLAPVDLGIVWGKLADPNFERYITFKSTKTLGGARQLEPRPKSNFPFDYGYLSTHMSHNHLIPANNNILKALMSVKKKDIITLQGSLVDIFLEYQLWLKTSLSRTDVGVISYNQGACEIMYVKRVKIGDKVYQ